MHSKLYQELVDTIMSDFSSPTFTRDCEELDRLKEKIMNIVQTNQQTHFNFDNLVKRTLARQSNNVNSIRGGFEATSP